MLRVETEVAVLSEARIGFPAIDQRAKHVIPKRRNAYLEDRETDPAVREEILE